MYFYVQEFKESTTKTYTDAAQILVSKVFVSVEPLGYCLLWALVVKFRLKLNNVVINRWFEYIVNQNKK